MHGDKRLRAEQKLRPPARLRDERGHRRRKDGPTRHPTGATQGVAAAFRQQLVYEGLRPLLLAKYPEYGIEHIRDNLRFKCITASVSDAFVFLELLVDRGWPVIKMDIDKFVSPKEWYVLVAGSTVS